MGTRACRDRQSIVESHAAQQVTTQNACSSVIRLLAKQAVHFRGRRGYNWATAVVFKETNEFWVPEDEQELWVVNEQSLGDLESMS